MNTLSDIFLQGAQLYTVILIIVVGLVFIDRRTFLRALAVLLSGMVFNVFLKSLFKVPLKNFLHKDWYAFPSGHAQSSTTFYGYLIHRYRNPLLTLIGALLIMGICWALVHRNYHDWIDVIAAVGFAIIWIIVFHWLDTSSLFKDNFMLLVILLTLISYFLGIAFHKVGAHSSIALGALIGLSITATLEKMYGYATNHPIIDFLIIIGGILCIELLFKKVGIAKHASKTLEFALISFWGTYSPHIFAKLKR